MATGSAPSPPPQFGPRRVNSVWMSAAFCRDGAQCDWAIWRVWGTSVSDVALAVGAAADDPRAAAGRCKGEWAMPAWAAVGPETGEVVGGTGTAAVGGGGAGAEAGVMVIGTISAVRTTSSHLDGRRPPLLRRSNTPPPIFV